MPSRRWSRAAETVAPAFANDDHAGALARDLPETAPRVTWRRLTIQPSVAPLTCSVAWVGEVVHGDVNHPHINGMQGVRGSNPLSSTAFHQAKRCKQQPWPAPQPLTEPIRQDPLASMARHQGIRDRRHLACDPSAATLPLGTHSSPAHFEV